MRFFVDNVFEGVYLDYGFRVEV